MKKNLTPLDRNNDERSNDERLVRAAHENPTKIVHGAAAIDPRLQNGRNATHQHDNAAAYGESEEEKRNEEKRGEELSDMVKRRIEILETLSNEDAVPTQNRSRSRWLASKTVYQPGTKIALYEDNGIACNRIGTSVAKYTDQMAAGNLSAIDQLKGNTPPVHIKSMKNQFGPAAEFIEQSQQTAMHAPNQPQGYAVADPYSATPALQQQEKLIDTNVHGPKSILSEIFGQPWFEQKPTLAPAPAPHPVMRPTAAMNGPAFNLSA